MAVGQAGATVEMNDGRVRGQEILKYDALEVRPNDQIEIVELGEVFSLAFKDGNLFTGHGK